MQLPSPSSDQPAWGRVGVIAAVGFVIGVVWPRLAGISLGPNPPADTRPAAAQSATAKTGAPAAAALASNTIAIVPPDPSAVSANGTFEQTVIVPASEITLCRNEKGKTPEQCDALAIDPLLQPRIKELAKCPSAMGLSGKLQLVLELDFKRKTIKVQRLKSKLPRTTIDGVVRCTERSLAGLSLDDLAHENLRYVVEYNLAFYPPGKSPETEAQQAADEKAPAAAAVAENPDGAGAQDKTAAVRWNSVQIRETPNGTAIGKVTRGTSVKVLGKKEKWVQVEYSDGKKGWVYGDALNF